MQDELVDDLENQAPRKGPRASPVADGHEPQGPSFAKVALWIGLGCFTFVAIMGVIVAVGLNALWTIVKDQMDPGAPAEVVEFKVGDPLPEPPLQLPVPPVPATRLRKADLTEVDLTEVDPHELAGVAQHFYENGDFQTAIQCQHISVMKSDVGRYNLACYYARAGDLPAALYWLQTGARDEEANAEWTSQDGDLVRVRKDARWPALWRYLSIYQQYWESTNLSEASLVVPHGSNPSQPLPVFVGLHGLGSNPSGFVDPEMYQSLADQMGVAFLGVSGTLTRGKHSFVWSEDPVKDLARIDAALQEAADRFTPAEGQIVLFGFSQGGWLAAELAARHPSRFAGAIILSPGCRSEQKPAELKAQPEHRRQGIVVVCGAGENPSTVAHTQRYAALFEKLGARVYKKIYNGMNTHSFPPGYADSLPVWGKFILNPQAPVP